MIELAKEIFKDSRQLTQEELDVMDKYIQKKYPKQIRYAKTMFYRFSSVVYYPEYHITSGAWQIKLFDGNSVRKWAIT